MIDELFRQRVPGFGWVALEKWPDGIKLRMHGYYVYEQNIKVHKRKPNLALIEKGDTLAPPSPSPQENA